MAALQIDKIDVGLEQTCTLRAGVTGRCAASVTTRMDRSNGGWTFAPMLSHSALSSNDLCKNSALCAGAGPIEPATYNKVIAHK
ncbi:MAG: hypothetical protein ABI612_18175 [Betaproteobacteria bacterium]